MRIESAEINKKLMVVRFVVAVDTEEDVQALQEFAERKGLVYHRNFSDCVGLYKYCDSETEATRLHELLRDFVFDTQSIGGWRPM
jgi:hypothetical protein